MSNYQRYLLSISATILIFAIADVALLPRSDVYLDPRWAALLARNSTPGLLFIVLSSVTVAAGKRTSGVLKDVTVRVAEGLQDAGWFLTLYFLFVTSCSLFIYLVADTQRPLMDGAMASFDQTVGFNWPAVVKELNASPAVAAILLFSYRSIPFQVVLTGILFAAAGKGERLFKFAATLVCALSMTALWMMAIPTAGAYAFYHPTAEIFSNFTAQGGLSHLPVLDHLRASAPFEFTPTEIVPLISFPSFHTALGILITYAYRQTIVFAPVALINTCMVVATLPEGGHHFADVLGGAIVAIASIVLVGQIGHRAAVPDLSIETGLV